MKTRRLRFPRFRDLSASDLSSDLHVHTRRTDGEADIEAILSTAEERGLLRIALTEHVRRDTDWFEDFVREVRGARRWHPDLQILAGCETKALDTEGTIDVSDGILGLSEIVLGSVHRFPDGNGSFIPFDTLGEWQFALMEYELALGLVTAAPIDVLAHPGGMYARRFHRNLPAEMMRHLASTSLKEGVAVEVNARYIQNAEEFFDILTHINPYVSLGSDMHTLEQLGTCRDVLKTQLPLAS